MVTHARWQFQFLSEIKIQEILPGIDKCLYYNRKIEAFTVVPRKSQVHLKEFSATDSYK